jgi:hypothetical protein
MDAQLASRHTAKPMTTRYIGRKDHNKVVIITLPPPPSLGARSILGPGLIKIVNGKPRM